MRMMALQIVATLLILVAGLAALRVAHFDVRSGGLRRSSWLLSGFVWTAHGVIQLFQNLWGSWAMSAGSESATMTSYLAWAPALNHSRTFLWLAACFSLVWLTFAPASPTRRGWTLVAVSLGLGTIAGAVFGLHEGTLRPITHYSNVAILDAIELVFFLTTLFFTLFKDRVDRYLWGGLLVWALTVAINILWYAALSLVDDPRAWTPAPVTMGLYRAVLLTLLCSIFFRRLHLARRGLSVGGFVTERRTVVSTFSA
jgi:hypothetical protein